MRSKYVYALLLSLTTPVLTNAQRYFGIATGNESGLNSLYLNPANIAATNDKYTIDLFSVNTGIDNNSVTLLNTRSNIGHLMHMDSVNLKDVVNFSSRNSFSIFGPYAEYHLPGFMMQLKNNQTIAITARVRAINQVNNFNQDFYRTLIDDPFRSTEGNFAMNMNDFNLTTHIWSEVGVTYAGVLYDDHTNRLNGGMTLRYLNGIAYASIVGKQLDGNYDAETHNINFNTNVSIASNMLGQAANNLQNMNVGSMLFGNNGGHGWGGDIGMVYEYRPYDKTDMYKLKVSMAVTDIGAIKYTGSNKVINMSGNGSININQQNDSVKDYNSLISYLGTHGLKIDSSSRATKVHMPTTIVAAVDYNVTDRIYASLTYMGNVVNRDIYGNSYYNELILTPRYETKKITLGMPISYSSLTSKMKMGMGVRVGGFYIGSDDMLAFFSNGQNGINLYLGAFVHINPRKGSNNYTKGEKYKYTTCPNFCSHG